MPVEAAATGFGCRDGTQPAQSHHMKEEVMEGGQSTATTETAIGL